MRIGFTGRFGLALILLGLLVDFSLRAEWKLSNPSLGFWEPTDPYLPVILFFGLLCLAVLTLWRAVYKEDELLTRPFSLTSVGPFVPQKDLAGAATSARLPQGIGSGEISPPNLLAYSHPPRSPLLRRCGFGLIAVAVVSLGLFKLWVSTLNFVPLEITVKLRPGNNRLPEFPIRVRGWYWVELQTDWSDWSRGAEWPQRTIHWQVTRLGPPSPRHEGPPPWSGAFWGEPGTYRLELGISSADTWTSGRRSFVWVRTDLDSIRPLGINVGALHRSVGPWLLVLLVWTGFVLIASDARQAVASKISSGLGRSPRPLLRPRQLTARQPVFRRPLAGLTAFGPVAALMIGVLPLFFLSFSRLTPYGFKIYVPKPGTIRGLMEPWNEPVVVRVGPLNTWYVNRTPVRHGELERRVSELLLLHGDKTVYVDGDDSIRFQYTVDAVSAIRKSWNSNIVLVTPSMKEEDPRLDGRSPCEPVLISRVPALPYSYSGATVSYDIDEHGHVSNVRVRKLWGEPNVASIALRAAKMRFKPLRGCGVQEVESEAW
jgi:biopolymer transport protein ExbD